MAPMHHSNQQPSRQNPSSPSLLLSRGSITWVNSYSQGGISSNNNNYMTTRREYISQPPCNRMTLQTGAAYLSTDKVTKRFTPLIGRMLNLFGSWYPWCYWATLTFHTMSSGIGWSLTTTKTSSRPLWRLATLSPGGGAWQVPMRTSSLVPWGVSCMTPGRLYLSLYCLLELMAIA